MVGRREILKSAIVLAAGQLAGADLADAAAPAPQPSAATGSGPAKPFDYAWLKGQAHWLASNAYQPSKEALPPAMAKLGYDQYQSIRFRGDHALWADAGLAFGMNSRQQNAWMYAAGGLEMVREVFKKDNLLLFPAGWTSDRLGPALQRRIDGDGVEGMR